MFYLKDIIADTILPFISAIILSSSYKRLTAAFKIMCYYIWVIVIIFSVTNILADYRINNLFLYHYFTLVNVFFVSMFLYKSFLIKIKPAIFILINTAIIIGCIVNLVFFESIMTLDMNMVIVSNFIILCLCFVSFMNAIKENDLIRLIKPSHFLFLFGIFIYAVSSIAIYSYFKYKNYQGKELSNSLWFFHDNVLIIKYVIFILASFLFIRNK